jgi:hypothetical protein
MEGRGGREAQGVADPKKDLFFLVNSHYNYVGIHT